MVIVQPINLLDVFREPAISKREKHHRLLCAAWTAAEFERLCLERSTIKSAPYDQRGGGSGNCVGMRIIILWNGDGFFDDVEYDVLIALSQPSVRALTKGHTRFEAPGRSNPPL